jgi:hypothetical protein
MWKKCSDDNRCHFSSLWWFVFFKVWQSHVSLGMLMILRPWAKGSKEIKWYMDVPQDKGTPNLWFQWPRLDDVVLTCDFRRVWIKRLETNYLPLIFPLPNLYISAMGKPSEHTNHPIPMHRDGTMFQRLIDMRVHKKCLTTCQQTWGYWRNTLFDEINM